MWQNQRVLDILNRPLTTTQKAAAPTRSSRARATTSSSRGSPQESARSTAAPPRVDRGRAAARSELLAQAKTADALVAAAPEIRPRRPVTLGVSEPFMQTLKVSAYAGLLLVAAADPLPALRVRPAGVLPAEKQVALPAMLAVPFLFIGGVVFGYYTVVPRAI